MTVLLQNTHFGSLNTSRLLRKTHEYRRDEGVEILEHALLGVVVLVVIILLVLGRI